jgi:hypothetical protein
MSFKNNYRVRKWESESMATLGVGVAVFLLASTFYFVVLVGIIILPATHDSSSVLFHHGLGAILSYFTMQAPLYIH